MNQPETVDATFYVQVEPEWFTSSRLRGAKAIRLTQSKPNPPKGGTVTCKLTVRLPSSAFLPLRPEAVIVVPEGMVIENPIEVEAVNPE